jgi:hypothetical protein
LSAEPQGYEVDWTDPASLIALKATGCDCRKHGYKHIHDLCIADAAKVRPHIVPLVEALQALARHHHEVSSNECREYRAAVRALNPEE